MPLSAQSTGRSTDAWANSHRWLATNVIELLTAGRVFGHFGQTGELVSKDDWRIDRQRPIGGKDGLPGKSNLQLQKNGVKSPSTVACLLVPDAYLFGIAGPDADNRHQELTRVIRQGLNLSLKSWGITTEAGFDRRDYVIKVFEVTGEFSSPKPEFVSSQKPVK